MVSLKRKLVIDLKANINREVVLGSVVLYNPDEEIFKNISTYLDYVKELIVVDNSELENLELKTRLQKMPKVHYVRNGENLGIARALNIAAEYGIARGYKWLLTMDQDTCFYEASALEYFDHFNQMEKAKLAILSPYQLNVKEHVSSEVVQLVMTSANIISLKCFVEIGGFNNGLFIDEVDHDYCLRAIQAGYDIKRVNIRISHALGRHRTMKFMNKKLVVSVHSPIRLYYITRNNLYMLKQYETAFPALMATRRKMLYTVLFNNIFFDLKLSLEKLKYIRRGIRDFKNNQYGKYK
jgi:rhamnosyltransferase